MEKIWIYEFDAIKDGLGAINGDHDDGDKVNVMMSLTRFDMSATYTGQGTQL